VGPLLQATRSVPIVFPVAGDPVGAGFVDSLARPGGNATGFMTFEEAIASGLISDNDALDLAPGLAGFVPPTMQQLQQRRLIGSEPLERLALDARNNPRNEPLRLAHLNHGDDCAILLEGGEGPARVKSLRHGGAPSVCFRAPKVPCLRRPPHSICTIAEVVRSTALLVAMFAESAAPQRASCRILPRTASTSSRIESITSLGCSICT
jgi:hypothetical protein